MRILVFTTAYKPHIGGSEIAIESIARELPDVFFDILTPRYTRAVPAVEISDNVEIRRIGLGSRWDKYLFPLVAGLYGWRATIDRKYDVLHSYQASFGALAAVIVHLLSPKIPFVLTLQEGKDLQKQAWIIRFLRNMVIRQADGVTAISRYLADFVQSVRPDLDVALIPNGVDVRMFSDTSSVSLHDTRRSLKIPQNRKILVTVSRLVPKNGLENLIRAMAIVLEEQPAHLLIVGSGHLQYELKYLAKELRVSEHVSFVGAVPHRQLPQYFSVADVFVRPSLTEGMGNVFIEAMAAGVPVVASPVGGIVDFVVDRKTGLFCDPKDPVSIADKILLLLEDKDLRETVIGQGKYLVTERYDWSIIAQQMNDLYNSIGLERP